MSSTEREKESLLPPICADEEHDWMSLSAHGCGALSDDQILSEAVVLGTKTIGGLGSVCNACFQIYGQPRESRHPDLVAVYLERISWEL